MGNWFEKLQDIGYQIDRSFGLDAKQDFVEEAQAQGIDIEENDASEAFDQVDEVIQNEDSFDEVQSETGFFKGFSSWKELLQEVGRETRNAQKQVFYVECFGAGVFLVIADNVTPVGKFVLGPLLINYGYSNSEFLKKRIGEERISKYTKPDWEKISLFRS